MTKKQRSALVKILVSAGLFGFLFYTVDRQALVENFKLLNPKYIPLITGLLILNYIVSSFRWKFLLVHKGGENVSIKYLTRLYFVGSFFNNFMPTSIGGDVYKFVKLGQKIQNKAQAFSATFMERFTGMIALVLISYYGMVKTLSFWVSLLPENISTNSTLLVTFYVLLFGGFWVGTLVAFFSLKFFAKRFSFLKQIYDSFMDYKNENRVLMNAFLTSFVVQFIAIFTQFFVFKAIGVDIPLDFALFIFPVITLIAFFVPSLNGLGVQDALYIQFFSSIGVGNPVALSASIIYHLFRLLVSLIGGVLYAIAKD